MSKTKIGDEQLSDEYYDLERILQPSASKVTKSWTKDMLNILEKISDPAMRALAMKQLKCIAEL